MQYAKIGDKLISLKLDGFDKPYKDLHNQTNASIYELWELYSFNGFNNPLQQADEALYKKMGLWAEITRDIIQNGEKGTDNRGRLHVKYISNAGMPDERITYVFAPKEGFWVPTDDSIFHEHTGIPFETVSDRKEAIRRCEAKNIPKEQVSYFYRLDNYKDKKRYVGRGFGPGCRDGGRFDVDADGRPSNSGFDWVASRPAMEKQEIVMEI